MDRVKVFTKIFDYGGAIMVPLCATASAAFGTAAYYAPTERLRYSMIASSAIALGIFPMTGAIIIPIVNQLKSIEKTDNTVKAAADGDTLIEKWRTLNTIRFIIMAMSFLNGLKELTDATLI